METVMFFQAELGFNGTVTLMFYFKMYYFFGKYLPLTIWRIYNRLGEE
jgi:hypothetical protein